MSTLMRFQLAPHEIVFEDGASYPARRSFQIFQVQDRTAGGKSQVENLGVKTETRTLNFKDMSKTDYDSLIDWFLNICNGGEFSFTFIDEYGDSGLVKITDSRIDFDETSYQLYSGIVNVEYQNA